MTERKSFLLRLNARLHQILERWAADDLRSINAQIEYLLMEAAKKKREMARRTTASQARD